MQQAVITAKRATPCWVGYSWLRQGGPEGHQRPSRASSGIPALPAIMGRDVMGAGQRGQRSGALPWLGPRRRHGDAPLTRAVRTTRGAGSGAFRRAPAAAALWGRPARDRGVRRPSPRNHGRPAPSSRCWPPRARWLPALSCFFIAVAWRLPVAAAVEADATNAADAAFCFRRTEAVEDADAGRGGDRAGAGAGSSVPAVRVPPDVAELGRLRRDGAPCAP